MIRNTFCFIVSISNNFLCIFLNKIFEDKFIINNRLIKISFFIFLNIITLDYFLLSLIR